MAAFEVGAGDGVLHLGLVETGTALPAPWAYWRSFGARLVTKVCTSAPYDPPHALELETLAASAPPMTGAEYLTGGHLLGLWMEMVLALQRQLTDHGGSVEEFLRWKNPSWNLVGRVHFNLAENRRDPDAPFAFLASYTTGLSAGGARAQHLPLGQALKEYAGQANRKGLMALLTPVQKAAELCPWLKIMVDSREIFHPLRWGPREAYRFLQDASTLESAGVIVRMPANWQLGRPSRPKVSVSIGTNPPGGEARRSLLDLDAALTVDGEPLSPGEIEELLAGSEGLAFIRGKWVELDRTRLSRVMERFRKAQQAALENGVPFAEAMRLLAGANLDAAGADDHLDQEWAQVNPGPWLAQLLQGLRTPHGLAHVEPGDELRARLRPYQQTGLQWLHLLSRLGLGACLADDMGLGKTIQVIALLLALKKEEPDNSTPSILVVPASLMANWATEVERFAPSLRIWIAHTSATPAAQLKKPDLQRLAATDLVVTTYGTLLRLPWLTETQWRLAVLDEAQAIKNPSAQQSQSVRKLKSHARIALTGTPVENRLQDLWSLFDFINPGLLGSAKQFAAYAKSLAERSDNPYGPLRNLVRPYILRRLKTDKNVIADLPDKTEVTAWCSLSRKQVALYNQAVDELAAELEGADGIQRRGIVLASLMRLKQICNHPSQWLGEGIWGQTQSGKFQRLADIAETISSRQEKVLVFTQFREITQPLAALLGDVFGSPGLVLHGGTPVKERKNLVERFQQDDDCPFFVLSLKAGGTGLNLTAASHVIHFDRWWNPAVENQATDRAFRIGQTRNVLVHKFVCSGTIEEKIDQLIQSKRQLASDVLEGGGEAIITEMSDAEIISMVKLDIRTAVSEEV